MLAAQQQQKYYCNKRHMSDDIAIGFKLLLPTTNLHLKTVGKRTLILRWVQPFRVTAHMGGMTYCLDLPACMHHIYIS